MVSLDFAYRPYTYRRKTLTDRAGFLPVIACLLAAALAVVTYQGTGEAGWAYASDLVLRFAMLVFPVALACGSIGRLILGPRDWRAGRWSRMTVLAFAAIYAVFLLCISAPYILSNAAMPLATTAFVVFNAFILCVLAITTSEHVYNVMGDRTLTAIHRIAACYFWITFAFSDVAHLYGPHRPDGFFGLSLSLLVLAVLIRFADAFVLRLKEHLALRARLAGKVG